MVKATATPPIKKRERERTQTVTVTVTTVTVLVMVCIAFSRKLERKTVAMIHVGYIDID